MPYYETMASIYEKPCWVFTAKIDDHRAAVHSFDDMWIAVGDSLNCFAKHRNWPLKNPFLNNQYSLVNANEIMDISEKKLKDMKTLFSWQAKPTTLAIYPYHYIFIGFVEVVDETTQVHRIISNIRTNDESDISLILNVDTFIATTRILTKLGPSRYTDKVLFINNKTQNVIKTILYGILMRDIITPTTFTVS